MAVAMATATLRRGSVWHSLLRRPGRRARAHRRLVVVWPVIGAESSGRWGLRIMFVLAISSSLALAAGPACALWSIGVTYAYVPLWVGFTDFVGIYIYIHILPRYVRHRSRRVPAQAPGWTCCCSVRTWSTKIGMRPPPIDDAAQQRPSVGSLRNGVVTALVGSCPALPCPCRS